MQSEKLTSSRKKDKYIDNEDYLIRAIFNVLKGYLLSTLAIILVSEKPL